MSDIPEMPKDWWPETITVTGKSSDAELCFMMFDTSPELTSTDWFKNNPWMDALRQSLWQALHDPEQRKIAMGLA